MRVEPHGPPFGERHVLVFGQMGNGLLDSSNGSIGDEAFLTVNSPPPVVDRTRIITAGTLRVSAT